MMPNPCWVFYLWIHIEDTPLLGAALSFYAGRKICITSKKLLANYDQFIALR